MIFRQKLSARNRADNKALFTYTCAGKISKVLSHKRKIYSIYLAVAVYISGKSIEFGNLYIYNVLADKYKVFHINYVVAIDIAELSLAEVTNSALAFVIKRMLCFVLLFAAFLAEMLVGLFVVSVSIAEIMHTIVNDFKFLACYRFVRIARFREQ